MRFYKKKRTPKESFQFVEKSSESWAFCRIYGKIDNTSKKKLKRRKKKAKKKTKEVTKSTTDPESGLFPLCSS